MNRFHNFVAQAIHRTRLFIAALVFLCMSQNGANAACADAPHFLVQADEAIDTRTGLVWKRCSSGLAWRGDEGCVGTIGGLSLQGARDLAAQTGHGWRLPDADELLSLVARDCGEPAIDAKVFPDVPLDAGGEGSLYWSSTDAGMLDMTVTVDFRDGSYDMHSRGLQYLVRLVRSPQR
jgi:hypothetical protein